jgi:hypothetical protein
MGYKIMTVLTKNDLIFIEKATKTHKDRYDYSECYVVEKGKRKIICKTHGPFMQQTNYHTKGGGCTKCYHDSLKYSFEEYCALANKVHNNKYTYIRIIETPLDGKDRLIEYYCTEHNLTVIQTVSNHMNDGNRCPKCVEDITRWGLEEFIIEARKIHENKYNYIELDCSERTTKVIIECPKHNRIFTQLCGQHLVGKGCKDCARQRRTRTATAWLNYMGIPEDDEHREVRINLESNFYYADGFDPITNTIYEFYGDYYHGNLNIYDPNKYNKTTHCTHGELNKRTIIRENNLLSAGYKIITIWESDWNDFKKLNNLPASPSPNANNSATTTF